MKKLLEVLHSNSIEFIGNEQLKCIKGGEVHDDAEDMIEVE